MSRYAFIALMAAALPLLSVSATPARAACVTNPAICKAICGCSCCTTQTGCGSGGFKVKAGDSASRALSRYKVQDLMSTFNEAQTDPVVKRTLAVEIKRRGG